MTKKIGKSRKKHSVQKKNNHTSLPSVWSGICSGSLILITIFYCWQDLFPEQSPLQIVRLAVYSIFAVCFIYAAFMHCTFPESKPHYKQLKIIVFLTVGVYYILAVNTEWFFGGDAGMYIVLTKSLATFQGFVELNEFSMRPHTLYGFGLPILLVPAYWMFGPSMTAFNTTLAFVSIGFIYCLYLLFRNQLGSYLIIMFIIAIGVNYWVVQFSAVVMTEAPFYLFLVLTFLAVYQYDKEEKTLGKWFWAVVLLTYFTYQVKAIGMGLFGAVILYFLIRKNFRKAGVTALSLMLLFLAWNIRNYFSGSLGYFDSLLNVLSAEQGSSIGAHEEGLGFIGNVFWKPIRNLIYGWKFLTPMIFSSSGEVKWIPIQIFLIIVGYYGFIVHSIKKCTVYDIVTVLFFLGITLYAGVLFPERWWMSFIPFSLYYILFGWTQIKEFLQGKITSDSLDPVFRILAVIFLGVVFALGIQTSDPVIVKSHAAEKSSPSAKAYVEAARWVKDNTPEDARIASRLDKEFYIISDRQGINSKVWHKFEYTYNETMRDEVLTNLQELIAKYEIDYWILDMTRSDSQVTIIVLQQNPENFQNMFEIVYAYPQPPNSRAFVLKVKKEWFRQLSQENDSEG